MASAGGNPNQFDMQKLFRPPSSSSNPSPSAPFHPPASYTAGAPPSPYPPAPSGFSYPPHSPQFHHHPFIHYPQENLQRPTVSYPVPPPHLPIPNPSPNGSGPNPGARLMALLGNSPQAQLEFATSMPAALGPVELAATRYPAPSAPPAVMSAAQALPARTSAQVPPARLPSAKIPRGRPLGGGERSVHDVDSRLPGETQPPQLEVTPITKYISDPGLVLGKQIAVNRTYICYGLKLGTIRVLNINTALRSLLRGIHRFDLPNLINHLRFCL
ncbi:hypothetical protein HPP92_017324 [Vanilla planifolia]|uniref:Uncharacterized protein n=1 Tax=Vanilla planifolia TaxID=51239 RepID=A0A835UQG8_VANPL|nr:hypothetical protein HPP92_017324 [Vanilla planifolia]